MITSNDVQKLIQSCKRGKVYLSTDRLLEILESLDKFMELSWELRRQRNDDVAQEREISQWLDEMRGQTEIRAERAEETIMTLAKAIDPTLEFVLGTPVTQQVDVSALVDRVCIMNYNNTRK